MKTTVIRSTKQDSFNEWFTLPFEYNRIRYYNHSSSISQYYNETDFMEDDTKWCLAFNEYKIHIGTNHFYTKRKTGSGLTFDKKTKKVKQWYGKTFHLDTTVVKFLTDNKIANIEWIEEMHPAYCASILKTNTILSRVLSGKLTNWRDTIKHYLKYSLKINVSPELYYQYLKKVSTNRGNLQSINYTLKHVVNADAVIKRVLDGNLFTDSQQQYDFDDLIRQGMLLGRKVDVNWSHNRMKQVHNEWTKELMEIELQHMEDYKVEYEGRLMLPENFKLIDNQKELFEVGKTESHCVYTNYWPMVKDKTYFVLYGTISGETYTVGIVISYYNDIKIDQIQKKYNGGASEEVRNLFNKWIQKSEVKQFFRQNYSKKEDVKNSELYEGLPV